MTLKIITVDKMGKESVIVDEMGSTVKFLNFLTPESFAVNYLKFKQKGQTL